MPVSAITKPQIKEYLLGRLEGDEMLELEGELLADKSVYELLEEAEYELIDAYLVGRLSSADRRQFEAYFLRSPKRKEQLEFSRSLHQVAGDHLKSLAAQPSPGAPQVPSAAAAPVATPGLGERLRSWWRSLAPLPQFGALAAASLVLLVGGLVWSLARNAQLRDQLSQERAERAALEQKNADQSAKVESLNSDVTSLKEVINSLTDDPVKRVIINALLTTFLPGTGRGGDPITPQKVIIPMDADLVRLQFPVQTDRFSRFNISLIRVDGSDRKEIWQRSGVTVSSGRSQELRIRIPVALLKGREYALKLTGVDDDNNTESVGEYRFEVVRPR